MTFPFRDILYKTPSTKQNWQTVEQIFFCGHVYILTFVILDFFDITEL